MGWTARLVVAALFALAAPADASDPTPRPGGLSPGGFASSGPTRDERDFLEKHWRRGIPPQGPAPTRYSSIERSLQPEACGACHPVQFSDWQASLHSKSMGPGVAGQLVEMARREPAAARSCSRCHAPVAEQRPQLVDAGSVGANADFDSALRTRGVICASCHVRRHEHFGPPRKDGSTANRAPRGTLPHNGVTRTAAFLRAEFCASCHQFDADGLSLNGKPLEDTYEEWRRSPAAGQGLQCQNCHMPDRRHLWRGIHDADMVRSGVEITLRAGRARYRAGDLARATLSISTPRVGHAFPTYVTPQVVVRALLVDGQGQPVAGSIEVRVIARQVPLDLSRELSDTRIQPGGRFTLAYARRIDAAGLRLRVSVTVLPDEFYSRFFEALLAAGAGDGEAQIREALEATHRSAYTLYVKELPLS